MGTSLETDKYSGWVCQRLVTGTEQDSGGNDVDVIETKCKAFIIDSPLASPQATLFKIDPNNLASTTDIEPWYC